MEICAGFQGTGATLGKRPLDEYGAFVNCRPESDCWVAALAELHQTHDIRPMLIESVGGPQTQAIHWSSPSILLDKLAGQADNSSSM